MLKTPDTPQLMVSAGTVELGVPVNRTLVVRGMGCEVSAACSR